MSAQACKSNEQGKPVSIFVGQEAENQQKTGDNSANTDHFERCRPLIAHAQETDLKNLKPWMRVAKGRDF
ncbi:MAG: hypothetical protein V6Z86_06755 [Hyphomicrobiales bacterium]